jgi:hypothetical protein
MFDLVLAVVSGRERDTKDTNFSSKCTSLSHVGLCKSAHMQTGRVVLNAQCVFATMKVGRARKGGTRGSKRCQTIRALVWSGERH